MSFKVIITDSIRSGTSASLVIESLQAYESEPDYLTEQDIPSIAKVRLILSEGSTGLFMARDFSNAEPAANDIDLNGNSLLNIQAIKDLDDVIAIRISTSSRHFNGIDNNTVLSITTVGAGPAVINSGGWAGSLQMSALTANRSIPFQDINYTGVADLADVNNRFKVDFSNGPALGPLDMGNQPIYNVLEMSRTDATYENSLQTIDSNKLIGYANRTDGSKSASWTVEATNGSVIFTAQVGSTGYSMGLNTDDGFKLQAGTNVAAFKTTLLSDFRNFEYPDEDGTIAIQSDLDAYLPLAGLASMTGKFNLSADATTALEPITYQQFTTALEGYVLFQGGYDASINLYPTNLNVTRPVALGAVKAAYAWYVTVAGTLGGVAVAVGDEIVALIDSPGQTAANWLLISHEIGYTPIPNAVNSGNILVGNASNIAASVTPTLNATGGTFALSNTGVFTFQNSSASLRGLLTSADWNTFNNKQATLTLGNLTETTSSILAISGGTGAIVGSGLTIQVKKATTSQDGYLSATDWTTFNSKLTATLSSAKVNVGNATNVATPVNLSLNASTGAFSFDNTGQLTFPDATAATRGFASAQLVADEVFTVKKSISSAQILTSFTTPITFGIPSPGVGKYAVPLALSVRSKNGTTIYATNLTLNVRQVGGNVNLFTLSNILNYTGTHIAQFPLVAGSQNGNAIIENADFQVLALTNNPTAGDGDLDLIIHYKLSTL